MTFAEDDIERTRSLYERMPFVESVVAAVSYEMSLQKDRGFLWLPVLFSCGIGFYFLLKTEPPIAYPVMVFASMLSGLGLLYGLREQSDAHKAFWVLVLSLSLVACGFLSAQIRTMRVYTPIIKKAVGPTDVTGHVMRIESLGEGDGSRIWLNELEVERLDADETPRVVRLKLRKSEGVKVGQRIQVLAKLNPPSPPVMPGAFDFQRYAFFRGIGAVGFIYTAPEILESEPERWLGTLVERSRQSIGERVQQALAFPEAGVVSALMIGSKTAIDKEDLEAMRDAGLAHMLAISGLHVGLVAGVLFFLSRLVMASFAGFALRHPIKKYAAVFAILGAFIYMQLAGATIPTQRAMLMTGIVFLAITIDRSPISLRLVAFAALCVLFISPESLLSVSFQMSFAAVAALIGFYDMTRQFWGGLYAQAGLVRKISLYFVSVSLTTLIASIATGLFAVYHFQHLALFSLVANVLAVPLMAFIIMPMAVFAFALMPLGLEYWPLFIMGQGVGMVLEVAHWVQNMEGSVLAVRGWPFAGFLCFVLGGLSLILVNGRLKVVSLLFLIVGVLFVSAYRLPDILVSSKADVIGIFDQEHASLFVSTKRKDKFVRENWARLLGVEDEHAKHWREMAEPMHCGEMGCRMVYKGYKIAFPSHEYVYAEECSWADVIIATRPIQNKYECGSPVKVDKFDAWDGGAHSLYLAARAGGNVVIKTVNEERGQRPWSMGRRK